MQCHSKRFNAFFIINVVFLNLLFKYVEASVVGGIQLFLNIIVLGDILDEDEDFEVKVLISDNLRIFLIKLIYGFIFL